MPDPRAVSYDTLSLNQLQEAVTRPEVDVERLVIVEAHRDLPGQLLFQAVGSEEFLDTYSPWLSDLGILTSLSGLAGLSQKLAEDGHHVFFHDSCDPILEDWRRWSEPLHIEGYNLYPFQQFALRRALEQDFWFFNFSAGAGKSFISAAGAKHLFEHDCIDVAIVLTIPAFKHDMEKFYRAAGLDVVVNDGAPARRTRVYKQRHQVYIANYEKMRVDETHWATLTKGRRVLYVVDEVQHIVTDRKQNKARKAFDRVTRHDHEDSKIWAMSATVVDGNPLRYRDVLSLGLRDNELGDKNEFMRRYSTHVDYVPLRTKTGYMVREPIPHWSLSKLREVPHRVARSTSAIRKTDPELSGYFKDMKTLLEPVELSQVERAVLKDIVADAQRAALAEEDIAPYYTLMRTFLNTPQALRHTAHPLGAELWQRHYGSGRSLVSSKLEKLNENLRSIRDQGDKAIVFTHWTNLTLLLIAPLIEVPLVTHYGTGQSTKDSIAAREQFREDPDITCFLTSDAGKEGLSMQCARYVIQYEPTYSHDAGVQRASRIHRADSHLDGLVNYIYYTENTVEERVLKINDTRRKLTEAVQGTVEALSESDLEAASRSEKQNYNWLLFG